jgi:hypothetical protein
MLTMAKSKSAASPRKPARATMAATASPASPIAAPVAAKPRARAKSNGAAAKPAVRKSAGNSSVVMTLSHDQIAQRAYEIWLAKGRPMGQDEQNWREAEMSLRGELQPA